MGGFSSGLFHGTLGSLQLKLQDEVTIVHTNVSNSQTRREKLLNRATTNESLRLIEELYRTGAAVGKGGTADAIREEISNGNEVGGKSHIRKGQERLRQIARILKRNPNHPDRVLLKELYDELQDALEGN